MSTVCTCNEPESLIWVLYVLEMNRRVWYEYCMYLKWTGESDMSTVCTWNEQESLIWVLYVLEMNRRVVWYEYCMYLKWTGESDMSTVCTWNEPESLIWVLYVLEMNLRVWYEYCMYLKWTGHWSDWGVFKFASTYHFKVSTITESLLFCGHSVRDKSCGQGCIKRLWARLYNKLASSRCA